MSAPSLSVCSLHLSSLSLFSSESRQLEFRLRPKASAAEGRRRGGAAAGSASQESSAEKRSGAVGEARPGGGVSGWRGGSGNLLRVLALDGGCELRRGSSVFFFFNFFTIFFPKFFSLDLDAIVLLQIFSSYSQTFLFQTFSHQFFPFFSLQLFLLKFYPNFFSLDLDAKNFLQIFRIVLNFFYFKLFHFSIFKIFPLKIFFENFSSQNDKRY